MKDIIAYIDLKIDFYSNYLIPAISSLDVNATEALSAVRVHCGE